MGIKIGTRVEIDKVLHKGASFDVGEQGIFLSDS